jgi:intergrase/recombinase
VDWGRFKEWLSKDHTERVSRDIVSYARRYLKCLERMDLSDVNLCESGKRRMILSSLSNLAKFLGIYDNWRNLIHKYDIKWITVGVKDKRMIDRITKVSDPNDVYNWIKEVKVSDPELSDFMDLMAITGLRLVEAVRSYNLIINLSRKGKLSEYYNSDKQVLQHFKFKDLFLRKGKKAMISFAPKELIDRITVNEFLPSEYAIGKRVKDARFSDIREAHASILTKYLSQPEIDFLHGRVGTSVFMQNYFNPALISDLKDRVFKGIAEIQTKIS